MFVVTENVIELPKESMKLHGNVTVDVDFVFVNSLFLNVLASSQSKIFTGTKVNDNLPPLAVMSSLSNPFSFNA